MGKGKGSFDYWAARVAVSQIVFEIKGELHEQVVRDAMRLAGNKLPGIYSIDYDVDCMSKKNIGLYEFVRKGDPPVMGLTKMDMGVTLADMRRQTTKLPADVKAARLPATTPGSLPAATPTIAASP